MIRTRPQSAGTNSQNRPTINDKENITGSFFIQDKRKTDPYYRKARVGSAKKIIVRNGVPMAICYDIRNPRGEKLNHYKYTITKNKANKTIYQQDYCSPYINMHVGMTKKPLVPYNVNSFRSRLPEDLEFKQMNHKSNFDLGSANLINRKQFTSTYRDSYQKPIRYFQPNQGINSDMAKRIHYKFSNIEYGLKGQ
jgi:hypothetical protein